MEILRQHPFETTLDTLEVKTRGGSTVCTAVDDDGAERIAFTLNRANELQESHEVTISVLKKMQSASFISRLWWLLSPEKSRKKAVSGMIELVLRRDIGRYSISYWPSNIEE